MGVGYGVMTQNILWGTFLAWLCGSVVEILD